MSSLASVDCSVRRVNDEAMAATLQPNSRMSSTCARLGVVAGFALLHVPLYAPLHAQSVRAGSRDTVRIARDTVQCTTAPRDAIPNDTARSASLGVIKVTGRIDDLQGVATSASEGRVAARDLRLRPLVREGELLESVPGLIVTQHSGDGKANQLFVRGFNLDHGTDFQTRLDGMPVNSPSHAHGQGYTDLNFLIPEFVDYVDYRLGVQHASIGDFGSAGGAEFHLVHSLDRPFLGVDGGMKRYGRVVGGATKSLGAGTLLLGGELKRYDGPWDVAEGVQKRSAIARYTWGSPSTRISLLALGYRNRWRASDQIPLRSVTEGIVRPFGQIDSTLGGESSRYSLSGTLDRLGSRSAQSLQVFAIRSMLDLYSNFTYYLDDAARGDQFNQREQRTVVGMNAMHVQPFNALGTEHTLTVGLQSRVDVVDGLALYRTLKRRRVATVRDDDVQESATGLFASLESHWTSRLRTILGVRGDGYSFDVASSNTENSGKRWSAIASPKASMAFVPSRNVELYVSAGFGFHSNDARGTTLTVDPATNSPARRVDPLVRSRGVELGLRATPLRGMRSTLAIWGLTLDSELLFAGDGGATKPSAASRRSGVTWANYYRPIPLLTLDADVSLARARFVGVAPGESRVPGALENVVAAGVTWGGDRRGPFGALRLRHFGAYPLTGNNAVRASATTLVNGEIAFQLGDIRVQGTLLNLLNRRARDIEYFYASRLAGEPASGVEDIHFHPVEPRAFRLSLKWGL